MDLRNKIEDFLRRFGAFKIGVADPERGFGMAKEGCHPRDIMRDCRSVVVFVFNVGLDYYTTLDYFQKEDVESRVLNIYAEWVSHRLADLLLEMSCGAVVPSGFKDEKERIARLSLKLAAYEAGLGVFGRPSTLITPQYGPRTNIGAVLTDASIQLDKPLTDFNPCQECDECVKLCPVNAICKELPPPMGFRRSRCLKFVDQIREETNRRIRYCGYCYNCCPAGETVKKTFNLSKWRTLLDLNEQQRRTLLKTLNVK
nr:hypothetical protein [Candidatus Njordarchaeota archaeon]